MATIASPMAATPFSMLHVVLVAISAELCCSQCSKSTLHIGHNRKISSQSPFASFDCSLNGVIGPHGDCICDAPWRNGKAQSCEILDLGHTTAFIKGGDIGHYKNKSGDPTMPSNHTWTWGGSPLFHDGQWHLFFSEIAAGCGLLHYQTNSVVRHAVFDNRSSSWRVIGPRPTLEPRKLHWDSGAVHGPSIVHDPRSGKFLLYYMGTTFDGRRPDCNLNPDCPPVMNSSSRRIGLAWSDSIVPGQERWHRLMRPGQNEYESGMILSPRAGAWDNSDVSNAAPLLLPDGRIMLGYRAGGDGVALGGGIGMAMADSWNSTYTRHGQACDSMLFSAEDGALYRDHRGAFHFLVHRFASGNGSTAGSTVGGHAFSIDGLNWNYSQHACYNSSIKYSNGTRRDLYRRERPKPVVNSDGRLLGLWNGAWPCHVGSEDDDMHDSAAGCESFTIYTEVQ